MIPPLIAYKSDPVRGAVWHDIFAREAPDLRLVDWTPDGEAAEARFLVAWTPPPDLPRAMPRLEALFCIGAGIDHLPVRELPPAVQVVRMVDPNLTASMVEYVVMAVLALHRDLPFYRIEQAGGRWTPRPVKPAAERRVGIMGLGVLGQAAARAVAGFGFPVRGWSASPKALDGVETFAGDDALGAFLSGTDILVCLLPLTAATRGLLDGDLFARLSPGAGLVNAGRGGHVVEADLVAALEGGRLSGAVLDVLATEPPPAGHPLLAHPRVIATPHVASATQPAGAARQVIQGVRAHLRGEPIPHAVDRSQGY
ncbi:2-hydroxyacid dehydrogenase [Methylobacterium nonmethylotrophicum]|uniref:Glyoxylate/hydroxypyruvate reductase A n=1 Tax=Methylobacterium nonmethylotrophicum TaxID=1141884 RepID=A0A4Z0NHS4_9HYPH|nr:glyoxylate/hydroxypyruvate reductase A [Methylobacterium nonmethylotrophicum]TGD95839.1 glyoxylate/hydroxypyruvate reductase A [Methylobacterium nonmethylotrophicum]